MKHLCDHYLAREGEEERELERERNRERESAREGEEECEHDVVIVSCVLTIKSLPAQLFTTRSKKKRH